MHKSASVVICTYNDPIEMVEQCLSSLLKNALFNEIIIIDSSTDDSIKNICTKINHGNIVYCSSPPRGLSFARNEGLKYAQNEYVAFTDPDCIVDKDWLKNLYDIFQKYDAAIAGGRVLPKWLAEPPSVFKKSRLAWNVYSLVNQGTKIREVKKIVGANFMVRKSRLNDIGYFSTSIGRIKGTLLGGEETDLCERAARCGFKVFYTPDAVVWHQVPQERLTYKWMFKRAADGGRSRAMRGGIPEPYKTKYSIYDIVFLIITFLPYLHGFIWGKIYGTRK
ncbi:MAG TPA: glycosyltransferase [Candidatus Methylomirabilis sp.]|nr:glycosyltransferase [Candidatus Methylomirabilis sp.]